MKAESEATTQGDGGPTLRLRAEALDWRAIEGEVIAIEHETSTYLATNDSGAVLWEELSRGAGRSSLVDRLVERFGVERERAAADVEVFLRALEERGLLETC